MKAGVKSCFFIYIAKLIMNIQALTLSEVNRALSSLQTQLNILKKDCSDISKKIEQDEKIVIVPMERTQETE